MRVHPKAREKMVVCEAGGNAREASTFYEVLERFSRFTYVRLRPRTGRTHQLRVHMKHLGHSIVADHLYGGRETLERTDIDKGAVAAIPLDEGENAAAEGDVRITANTLIARQALHAFRLEFTHPATGMPMEFEAPLPADIQNTLDALRNTARRGIL